MGTSWRWRAIVTGDVIEGVINIYNNKSSSAPFVSGALDVVFAFQVTAIGTLGQYGVAQTNYPFTLSNAPSGTLAKLLTGSQFSLLSTTLKGDSFAVVSSATTGDITSLASTGSSSAFAAINAGFAFDAAGQIGAFDQASINGDTVPTTAGNTAGTEQGSLFFNYSPGAIFVADVVESELFPVSSGTTASASNQIGFTSQLAVPTGAQVANGWSYQDSSQIYLDAIVTPEPASIVVWSMLAASASWIAIRARRKRSAIG